MSFVKKHVDLLQNIFAMCILLPVVFFFLYDSPNTKQLAFRGTMMLIGALGLLWTWSVKKR